MKCAKHGNHLFEYPIQLRFRRSKLQLSNPLKTNLDIEGKTQGVLLWQLRKGQVYIVIGFVFFKPTFFKIFHTVVTEMSRSEKVFAISRALYSRV